MAALPVTFTLATMKVNFAV